MKTSAFVLTLCFALTFVRAASALSDRQIKAIQECNATTPLQSDPIEAVALGMTAGKPPKLNQEEKCFLFCYNQKIGFLDENANLRNPQAFINHTLTSGPRFPKYSDVIIAQVFQFARSAKGFEDKCLKAFVTYYEIFQIFFTLEIADGLQSSGVKDKIVSSLQSGQPINEEIAENVKKYLTFVQSITTNLEK